MYDVIIIGGGPAGLTAELYAVQKGLQALLISPDLGGKTNYRLALPWINDPIHGGPGVLRGMEMVNYVRSELEWLSMNSLVDVVESIQPGENGFVVVTRGQNETQKRQELLTKAVIVATGTHQVPLNVPGEKEYFLRGVGYSAFSYGPLFRDRVVAVVGEGELAIRSAAELATVARQVYFICSHTEMLAIPLGARLAALQNVEILDGYQVVEIKGGEELDEEFARSLLLRNPSGQLEEREVDGIFIERGLVPNSDIVSHLVYTSPAGYIHVDSRNCTNQPGIFAAGDVTDLYAENLLVALGEGAKAALSTYDYLLPRLI